MRILAAAVLSLAVAAPAAAQTVPYAADPMERLRLENRLALERRLDRQRALAADREAFAARQRARTAQVLRALEPIRPPPYAGPAVMAPLEGEIAAANDAIARRRAAELAASNARILAIRPASE